MTFKKIIELCEKNSFLKRCVVPRITNDLFRVGPVGALLQENLRTEWFYNLIVNKEYTVFMYNDCSLSDTFDTAKELCLETLPFGVAEFLNKKNISITELIDNRDKKEIVNFSNYFENSITMRCTMFVPPNTSTQFFHHWQRHRRMWWRKFSASPGRFTLTDIKNDEKTQSVEVTAKYPWGHQTVELIALNTNPHSALTAEQLQFKQGRKACLAHYIVSDICLSTMLLNTLCDAYEEPVFQGNVRPLFRFHRKIAPYKISFAVTGNQKSITDDLDQLALYLCKQLRSQSISCLLLPSSSKFTLEAQWKQYDQLGIPYTVHLNENTLKSGIILLRSRDTTLKEQVHVTNLVTYVEQLFKNY